MKQREVQEEEGTTWTCVQAYAGLNQDKENQEAAKVKGSNGKVAVVCTPSGGAQTKRLELPEGWMDSVSDDDLLKSIQENP